VDQHARALAEAIEATLPGWVDRAVRSRLAGAESPDAVIAAAGRDAAAEVGAAVRRLLAQDVDQQATTPLSLLRGAVRYPTAVLRDAGVPPVERDDVRARLFPSDVYDLAPATWSDVDPSLLEPGLAWGASKAYAHLQRHGGG